MVLKTPKENPKCSYFLGLHSVGFTVQIPQQDRTELFINTYGLPSLRSKLMNVA